MQSFKNRIEIFYIDFKMINNWSVPIYFLDTIRQELLLIINNNYY